MPRPSTPRSFYLCSYLQECSINCKSLFATNTLVCQQLLVIVVNCQLLVCCTNESPVTHPSNAWYLAPQIASCNIVKLTSLKVAKSKRRSRKTNSSKFKKKNSENFLRRWGSLVLWNLEVLLLMLSR